jgi:hypothetical protein
MRWKLEFHGRTLGAIGITCSQTVVVEADTIGEARWKTYDAHEHVAGGVEGVCATPLPEEGP